MKWYRLDINPIPWAVGPLSTKRVKGGKTIPFMGRNEELAMYQEGIKELMAKYDTEILEAPIRVTFLFWRKIEAYKTHQARGARNQEADATNLQKAVEDALHGIFYKNDKDNHVVTSVIVRQDTETEGKIIIGIEEISDLQKYDLVQKVPKEILDGPVEVPEDLSEEDARWIPGNAGDDF